jgi:CheY-like chemotaxis protein
MPTILLVEDTEMNRDVISRRLERKGYTMLQAHDGERGLDTARSSAPDLILMDMRLPGISGIDVVKLLKGQPETRRIPIIALTADAMDEDRDRALSAGCEGYSTKPVEFGLLFAHITAVLERTN